jgi:hypothetical protein
MDSTRRNLLIGGSIFGALALGGLLPVTCAKRQKRRERPTSNRQPKRPQGEAKPMLAEDHDCPRAA